MSDDLTLFELGEFVSSPTGERTIEGAFDDFHSANQWVYDALVSMARDMVARGHRRIGIGMLFEVLRWHWLRGTEGDEFKLNNNYRSRYARLIMDTEPDLCDVFETRELRAA